MALKPYADCPIPSAVLEFVLDREDFGHQATLPPASNAVKLHALYYIIFILINNKDKNCTGPK